MKIRFATNRLPLVALVFILSLTLIPLGAAALQDAPACDASMDYMTWGMDGITSGDYEGAASSFACAIEVDPANYPAYLWRGGLAASTGDYDQLGADLYTFMIHQNTGENETTLTIVRTVPTLTSAVKERPEDATLYLLRGLANVVAGITAEADFEKVIELAPENAVGYLFFWLNTNPFINPDFTDDNFVQGAALASGSLLLDWMYSFAAEDFGEAQAEVTLPYFNQIIQDNPDHIFAYAARAMAHVMLDDDAAATDDFYQHIQLIGTEEVWSDPLTLNETFNLDAVSGMTYHLPFSAEAGQRLNVSSGRVDFRVFFIFPISQVILNAAGEVLDAPYGMNVQMGGTFVLINGFEVPESGDYSLLLTPNYTGEVTVTVWDQD